MPAAIADWKSVKAHAIATGSLKEAADAFGLEEGTVRVRAHREEWPVGRRVQVMAEQAQAQAHAQIVKNNGGNVTAVTSAADAVANTLLERRNRTKLAQSEYLARASEKLADVDEEKLLLHVQDGKALADMAAKVHPEADSNSHMSLNFFSLSAPAPKDETEKPVAGHVIEQE